MTSSVWFPLFQVPKNREYLSFLPVWGPGKADLFLLAELAGGMVSCLWNLLEWSPGSWVSFHPFLFFQKELKKKQQLSICNKLCYAVGGAPYQVTGCALGFFLQIYLLDVAQVSGPSLPGPAQHPEVGKTRYSQAGSLRFPLL